MFALRSNAACKVLLLEVTNIELDRVTIKTGPLVAKLWINHTQPLHLKYN